MKSTNLLYTLLLVIFLMACSSKPNENQSLTDEISKEQKTIDDIEQVLKDLPPPSLVPFTLKSINAAFNKELVNDLSNMEKYKVNNDKMALNMGVYASDINYLAAYGHEDDCINYLKTAHSMAEFLGDSSIFGNDRLEAFRGHILDQNEEEISKILTDLFLETSLKMEQDNQLTMAGLALTGSFVEGLYHAVITLEKFPDTPENKKLLEPLVKIVLDEEKALLDIIQVLDDLPFDDTIAEMKTELSILDRLYKGDLQEVEEKIKNDPDYILNKEVMRDITLEVKELRKNIVE